MDIEKLRAVVISKIGQAHNEIYSGLCINMNILTTLVKHHGLIDPDFDLKYYKKIVNSLTKVNLAIYAQNISVAKAQVQAPAPVLAVQAVQEVQTSEPETQAPEPETDAVVNITEPISESEESEESEEEPEPESKPEPIAPIAPIEPIAPIVAKRIIRIIKKVEFEEPEPKAEPEPKSENDNSDNDNSENSDDDNSNDDNDSYNNSISESESESDNEDTKRNKIAHAGMFEEKIAMMCKLHNNGEKFRTLRDESEDERNDESDEEEEETKSEVMINVDDLDDDDKVQKLTDRPFIMPSQEGRAKITLGDSKPSKKKIVKEASIKGLTTSILHNMGGNSKPTIKKLNFNPSIYDNI